jgi:hypothetical protein
MIGVLTLEDVIERRLRLDINDERDRDAAVGSYLHLTGKYSSKSPVEIKRDFIEMVQKYSLDTIETGVNEDDIYPSIFAQSHHNQIDNSD